MVRILLILFSFLCFSNPANATWVVKELIDDQTFLAFRNLQNAYLVESNELNAYLAAAYHSVVIEKAVWDKLTKES